MTNTANTQPQSTTEIHTDVFGPGGYLAPQAPATVPIIQGDEAEHLKGLLTCGHYSRDIFNRSSTWDFTHEEQECPEGCANVFFTQEVQDLATAPPTPQTLVQRFQSLIADMVDEGNSPDAIGDALRHLGFGAPTTGVTLSDDEASALFVELRRGDFTQSEAFTSAISKLRGGYQRANTR